MWAQAAAALSGQYLCVMPDLRGHGRSPPPDGDGVTIADYADDCARALDSTAPRRLAVVCGLSMGGIITLEFFRRHRSRVRALVLCDTRANPETPEGVTTREQRARLALERGDEGVRAIADAMLQNLLAPGVDAAVRSAVRDMMLGTSPAGLAAASRALGTRPDLRPALGSIDVPTLLIVGEEDAITPPEHMAGMQRSIPGSRLIDIPGAGHLPPVERPDEFNRVLRAFVERL
jgi:pimeloyl-ACP methyl ester carboxylesterase